MIGSVKESTKVTMLSPDKWVELHGDYLYNYAYSRVQSKELAEDLVQDTFIAGLNAMNTFEGRSTEITWLISILKRKIIDHFRKASTKKEVTETEYASPFQSEGTWEGHWIMERSPKHWQNDLKNPMRQNEFQKILEYCLSILPEKWKAVFVLKFMEDVNSDEVCKELGCTPSNFWVILHRTRLKLRECIEFKWLNE
jgi:RNA polymerase sigma-70 factor (TIGR02943 family)